MVLQDIGTIAKVDRFGEEVCSHGTARTDIALLCDDILIGIEAKLTDWQRAIVQGLRNRYCVDRSYIAIWDGGYVDSACATAQRFGLGVFVVGTQGVRLACESELNEPEHELRSRMVSQLKEVGK